MRREGDYYICDPYEEAKRGRPSIGDNPMTPIQRKQRERGKKKIAKLSRVAVLDMETDPFDNLSKTRIDPFVACIYSDHFEPIVIWNDDPETFIELLTAELLALPDEYTIYAHNGGKFDFLFMVHKLRGHVKFKGRGIMCARLGPHEIRDSFHIIPEKLANWQKQEFDYSKMRKGNRQKYKDEIIAYLISDCRYLFEIVKQFLNEFGFKLSIGQAAIAELRKHYKTKRIGENMDGFLRHYFFGGRVECLMGKGEFYGPYKLYDVNSMYPYVMANYQHPIGNEFEIRRGSPGPATVFIDLDCDNYGALVKRCDNNETSAAHSSGRFRTTIWEFETALRYGLIDNVQIRHCIDCAERTDFRKFVEPLYERRQLVKKAMPELKALHGENSPEYKTAKKDDLFFKLILNNAYGKFAQNPRRFKECYITDPGNYPEAEEDDNSWGALPAYECETYWIWERPIKTLRFNNVATAASITGAARAVLLDAIHRASDPIYCDTDSLICRALPCEIDATKLGAWKLEKNLESVLIAGKKLYAYQDADLPTGHKDKIKVRSKGTAGLTWRDLQRILDDEIISIVNKAPTLTKLGQQHYITRRIRATASKGAAIRTRKRVAA